jgi:uncharacterized membrane protein YccC
MSDKSGTLAQKVEALMKRFDLKYDDLLGFRFAVNVFIATTIVCFILKLFHDKSPIWAVAAMVAASEPEPEEARRLFRSRIINVLVGCSIGFCFLLLGSFSIWLLPVALATTVLVTTYLVRVKTMWRQAPITAAIVIASGLVETSTLAGLEQGARKVVEVIFGCGVGLLVSWSMSKVWLVQKPVATPAAAAPASGITSN